MAGVEIDVSIGEGGDDEAAGEMETIRAPAFLATSMFEIRWLVPYRRPGPSKP